MLRRSGTAALLTGFSSVDDALSDAQVDVGAPPSPGRASLAEPPDQKRMRRLRELDPVGPFPHSRIDVLCAHMIGQSTQKWKAELEGALDKLLA